MSLEAREGGWTLVDCSVDSARLRIDGRSCLSVDGEADRGRFHQSCIIGIACSFGRRCV